MNNDLKKRIAELRAKGVSDAEINAAITAKQQYDATQSKAQQSVMTMADGSSPIQEQPKEGFIKGVARALVAPAVDYGKMIAGAGYEGYRGIKSATGDKNTYVDKQGNVVQNPFLSEKDLNKFQGAGGALEGAKRTAGMASYFVPGGKAAGVGGKILSGATQGAKVGGLYGFSQSEKDDLEGLAVDTATGALSGGVTGGVIGGVSGVVSKMKGAEAATAKSIVNPEVPATPTAMSKKDAIIKGLDEMGINKGTAEERMREVGTQYNNIQAKINKLAEASGATRDVRRLSYNLKAALTENSDYFVPDDPTYQKILDRELKLLAKKAENGVLKTTGLVTFKNELASKLGTAFKKVSGESSSSMTPIEGVRMDLWNNMDSLITRLEPKLKELTLKQSLLHKASPGLLKQAERVSEIKPFGFPTGINITSFQQGSADKVSRFLTKIGNMGGTIESKIGTLPVKAGAMVSASKDNKTQEVPGLDINSAIQEPTTAINPEEQLGQYEQQGADFSDEDMVVAMMQYDLQATGGKNIPELKTMYEISKLKGGGGKLSATQQKRIGALNQADSIYNMVEELALGAGTGIGAYGKATVGKLPGVEGGTEEDLGRVTLALAKGLAGALANEVGVATDKDIDRWMGLMPTITDTLDERKRVLKRLKDAIEFSRKQISTPEQGLDINSAVASQ